MTEHAEHLRNKMDRDIVHIVHWQKSGIYSVAKQLHLFGKNVGDVHYVRVIRKNKGALDFFLSIFRIFLIAFEVFISRKKIFHAHSFLPFMFLYLSFGGGAITFHNLYPYLSSNKKKDKLKKSLIKNLVSSRNILISSVGDSVARCVNNNMNISSVVIYNGLDQLHYKFNPPCSRRIIGAAGRFDDQKNFESLIKAFAMIGDQELTLKIAGDGVLRRSMEDLIKELGLEGRVVLLGFQDDMVSFFNSIDAFICSSFYEGFGIVIAEAALSGKHLISTNVGLVSDIRGLEVIKSGFSELDISESIKEWLQSDIDDLNRSVLNNKNVIVENLSLENVYREYVRSIWLESGRGHY